MKKIIKEYISNINHKRAIKGIACMLFSVIICILCRASIKAGIVLGILFFLVSFVEIRLNERQMLWLKIPYGLAVSFYTLLLSQLILNENVFKLSFLKFFLECC